MKGKKAVLVLGRGGVYADGSMKAMEYQETYLRTVLGFVGITDVETVLSKVWPWGQKNARKRWRTPGPRLPL